jgi:hypothetical protein
VRRKIAIRATVAMTRIGDVVDRTECDGRADSGGRNGENRRRGAGEACKARLGREIMGV